MVKKSRFLGGLPMRNRRWGEGCVKFSKQTPTLAMKLVDMNCLGVLVKK